MIGVGLEREAPHDQGSTAIPVESYLLEEVRSLSALLAGVEVVVDCEPLTVMLVKNRTSIRVKVFISIIP